MPPRCTPLKGCLAVATESIQQVVDSEGVPGLPDALCARVVEGTLSLLSSSNPTWHDLTSLQCGSTHESDRMVLRSTFQALWTNHLLLCVKSVIPSVLTCKSRARR